MESKGYIQEERTHQENTSKKHAYSQEVCVGRLTNHLSVPSS